MTAAAAPLAMAPSGLSAKDSIQSTDETRPSNSAGVFCWSSGSHRMFP
jgi:hypothetical protein